MTLPDPAHCLRPTFTQALLKRLQQGESVNIITADTADAERLGQDIQLLAPSQVCWVQVNMKSYIHSFAGFVQAVWQQLPTSTAQAASAQDWPAVVAEMRQLQRPVWLWLADFGRLLGDEALDAGYNWDFVNTLNALCNDAQFAVVGVTSKPLNECVWYIAGQQELASVLQLAPVRLQPLLVHEVNAELTRAGVKLNYRAKVRGLVIAHPHQQYAFLQFLLEKLSGGEYADLPPAERLARWQTAFDRDRLAWRVNMRESRRARLSVSAWIKDLGRWLSELMKLHPIWQRISRWWSGKGKP